MKYYGLPLQPMQESGAFLLRSMQNEEMPRLDLLVRESVQNALDASLEKRPSSEVRVDFLIRPHTTEALTSMFADGIDIAALRARYPAGGRLLEIRDSFTEGLTGPLTFEELSGNEPHGNLLKLVFEIGRTRSDDGAGGSWGLGKTCYFRMGAGLVIYYSRVKLGGEFQERLVASLVEDENKADRLQRNTRTGIAWWGAESILRPITCPSKIRCVITALGVRAFEDDETGTSISIPFLRDDLIPAEDADEENKGNRVRPVWFNDYESYIQIALQRWFCARLDNPSFAAGPYLHATVNGRAIRRKDMFPVFQATQSLYNLAANNQSAEGDYLVRKLVPAGDFTRKQVSLRNVFSGSGSAGALAAALLTSEQLGMDAPDNGPAPGLCVFGRLDSTPPYRPIVTFMRKPGMSICWDDSTESRGWAGGLPGTPDGRYLIAVFVPQHERVIATIDQRPEGAAPLTLEAYLRSCERADHAAWHDISGMKVVEKIRTNCGRTLRDFGGKPASNANVKSSIRMARNLADLVLPSRGYGTDGRLGRPTPPSSRPAPPNWRPRAATLAPTLNIDDVEYTADAMIIRWSLGWGAAEPSIPREINIRVDSEAGHITASEWLQDGLGQFPFRITGAELESPEPLREQFSIEMTSNVSDGIHVHAKHPTPAATATGMLRIEFTTRVGRTLRPVLAVGLVRGSGRNS